MTIDISDNDPRISYSVAEGVTQTTFSVPFEFFDDDDLKEIIETRERWAFSWLTGRGTYREDMMQNDIMLLIQHYFLPINHFQKIKYPGFMIRKLSLKQQI